jgi:anthranilate phosphoribosyltransferase
MENTIKVAINKLIDGKSLTRSESRKVMTLIMQGKATDAQISAFLVAMRMKGETVEEVTGAAEAMTKQSKKIKTKFTNIVDTCGTGGDSLNTFNISTTAAFIAAGAGVAVAKHGYHSVSSKCGSADVLMNLGIKLDLPQEQVEQCLYDIGITFIFAPKFQASAAYAFGPRSEIGARTIFNILGPLTNPARTKRQVIGVYDQKILRLVVEVLKELGSVHVMAVHGNEGIDEISISGSTKIVELINGTIYEFEVKPENFQFLSSPLKTIQSKTCATNKKYLINALKGKKSAALDIALLNAGAAIKVSGKVDSLDHGIKLAIESVKSGAALDKLEKLIKYTNSVN